MLIYCFLIGQALRNIVLDHLKADGLIECHGSTEVTDQDMDRLKEESDKQIFQECLETYPDSRCDRELENSMVDGSEEL